MARKKTRRQRKASEKSRVKPVVVSRPTADPEPAAAPQPRPPPPQPIASPPPPISAWVVLAIVAVVVRAIYFVEHSSSPFFHGLVLDEANYDALGWSMASGEGLWEGVLTFNPLQPLILAAIYSIGGHDLAWPRMVQLIADLAMVGGVSVVTGRLVSWRAGLISGFMAALYGPAIFYAGELLAECWSLSFLALSLAAMTGRSWRWRLLAGLLMGVAVLGRPNLVLFYPVLGLWWFWSERGAGLIRIAPLIIGMLLAISPITTRNIAAGDAVMMTAHGGINLFIGNNKDASGWFKIPRGTGLAGSQQDLITSAQREAEKDLERELRPSEVSDYWRDEAVSDFTKDPVAATTGLLRKTAYFFNAYEKPMVANYHYAQQNSAVLTWGSIGLAPVMILGGIGMVLGWSRRRKLAPLYILVVTYTAGVVLFFVSMRYRLPVVAGLLPFAGLAVERGVVWLRSGRKGLPVVLVGVVLWSGVVLWPSVRQAELPRDMAHTHYYLGTVALDNEAHEQATAHFEDALSLVDDNVRYRHQYGIALYRSGRIDDAITQLEQVTTQEPIFLQPYVSLGIAYRKKGDFAEAEATYRRAILVSERYPFIWYNLGNVLVDQGRQSEARAAFEKALELKPDFAAAADGVKRTGG